MKKIWFKYKYFDLIKSGAKTQTIRFWKRRANLNVGDKFVCFFGHNKPELIGNITNLQYKNFLQLTESEIKADGYNCRKKLYQDLQNYIIDFNENTDLLLISFNLQ